MKTITTTTISQNHHGGSFGHHHHNNNSLLTNNNHLSENKSVGIGDEDDDVMFGRSYGTSFCRPNRPTMISAKYRQKEERRKVLKISINKLKKIEDPESSLRRSVLINNTMKRLQREAREEKMQKQQSVGFRCFASDFLKDDVVDTVRSSSDQLADITNLPSKKDMLGMDVDVVGGGLAAARRDSRKRSIEEVDESDVHAVLSQFYMPLTPRMLTSIDEDDDEINVVDLDCCPTAPPVAVEPLKRPRLDCSPPVPPPPSLLPNSSTTTTTTATSSSSSSTTVSTTTTAMMTTTTTTMTSLLLEPTSFTSSSTSPIDRLKDTCRDDPTFRLRPTTNTATTAATAPSESPFSCGHSSMFNELQSVVYHSLIASLET